MRKAILSAAILMAVTPALAAGDKVNVEYNGMKERFDVGDLKTTAVCAFKQRVASKFGLSMKKFDLKKSGVKLSGSKTLKGASVNNHNKLDVVTVSSSFQC